MFEKTHAVYIVDGARVPFLKAKGKPGVFSASDLAVSAGKPLLARQPFAATALDEVIVGCVMSSGEEANIGRVISLRLGCGHQVPGWTVQRNCASGLQALDTASQRIAQGAANLILVGGTEAMSRSPLLWSPAMVEFLANWMQAKTFGQRAKLLVKLRPAHFKPVIGLLQGLTDWTVGLNMGQTAEELAYRFGISRLQMDTYAAQSHVRALQAQAYFALEGGVPAYGWDGSVYEKDDGVRTDSTVERLGKLKPVFEKYGSVTAGNSSQVTDGAACMILASEKAVREYQLPVLGRCVSTAWAGLDPAVMGLGPAHAIVPLLQKNHLRLDQIGLFELNEAFAVQVLACQAALADDKYCHAHFKLPQAFGEIPSEKLNIDGGAIALGHPVGASGVRIVLQLLHALKRQKQQYGVATLCIGGGQGGAMLVENINSI